MIVYQLACPQDHFFEGWFASSRAFETQAAGGQLRCPTCATGDIRKLPAAPYVKTSAEAPVGPSAAASSKLRGQVVAELRNHLLATTDDVGRRFAEIARRIHYKEEAARNIRGRATVEEALELHEEGVEAHVIPPEVFPGEEVH